MIVGDIRVRKSQAVLQLDLQSILKILRGDSEGFRSDQLLDYSSFLDFHLRLCQRGPIPDADGRAHAPYFLFGYVFWNIHSSNQCPLVGRSDKSGITQTSQVTPDKDCAERFP